MRLNQTNKARPSMFTNSMIYLWYNIFFVNIEATNRKCCTCYCSRRRHGTWNFQILDPPLFLFVPKRMSFFLIYKQFNLSFLFTLVKWFIAIKCLWLCFRPQFSKALAFHSLTPYLVKTLLHNLGHREYTI